MDILGIYQNKSRSLLTQIIIEFFVLVTALLLLAFTAAALLGVTTQPAGWYLLVYVTPILSPLYVYNGMFSEDRFDNQKYKSEKQLKKILIDSLFVIIVSAVPIYAILVFIRGMNILPVFKLVLVGIGVILMYLTGITVFIRRNQEYFET